MSEISEPGHSWGKHWRPVPDDDPIRAELAAETAAPHPLAELRLRVSGRCATCDDVVADATAGLAFPDCYVVHLTWQGQPEVRDGQTWPRYARLGAREFFERFVIGNDHL